MSSKPNKNQGSPQATKARQKKAPRTRQSATAARPSARRTADKRAQARTQKMKACNTPARSRTAAPAREQVAEPAPPPMEYVDLDDELEGQAPRPAPAVLPMISATPPVVEEVEVEDVFDLGAAAKDIVARAIVDCGLTPDEQKALGTMAGAIIQMSDALACRGARDGMMTIMAAVFRQRLETGGPDEFEDWLGDLVRYVACFDVA